MAERRTNVEYRRGCKGTIILKSFTNKQTFCRFILGLEIALWTDHWSIGDHLVGAEIALFGKGRNYLGAPL